MSSKSDIEITVHNKKQLKVLVEKMLNCEILKFLFSGAKTVREESGVNNVPEWINYYEEHPKHCMVSLAYYKDGFILCIIVENKYRIRVKNFLNSIKIPEKTDEIPVLMKEKKGKKVNLYLNNLTKEKAEEVNDALAGLGIVNLEERPYYEQDPVY